jgi:nucleotide-binding universal stress UspA family protein
MIKKILVVLDADSDTAVAIRYATEIAKRFDASVTGLAVVDLGSISSGSKGGGIGSFYYAEKLREKLTAETRVKARELIETFESTVADAGIKHVEMVQEGVPVQRIVEDMKYHDLLVIGRDPHLFYVHPKKETPDTLASVVKATVSPSIVVSDSYTTIRRLVVAYDGSLASARTVRDYAYLKPFGPDVSVHLINVYDKDSSESELMLSLLKGYLAAHGIEATAASLKSDDARTAILDYSRDMDADMLAIGSHSVSGIKRIAFGSITEKLLKECPLPLFLNQ